MRAAVRGKLLFEPMHLRTENVSAARENTANGGVDLLTRGFVSQLNVVEFHESGCRDDSNAIDHKGRRFRRDIGIENVLPAAELLNSSDFLVKCAAGLDQPQNASFASDGNLQGCRRSRIQYLIALDVLDTPGCGAVIKDPEILFRTIIASDTPVHEPAIDVSVR